MSSVVQAIRAIIFYLLLGSFTAVWVTVLCCIIPFVAMNKRHGLMVKNWAKVTMWLVRIICGVRYEVHGQENIPDKPCVLISNHQSTWETFCLQTLFTPQSQVIKKELLKVPFFGWGFRLVKPIAINRDDPRAALRDIVGQGTTALKEGRWVLIFPEGTRTPDGGLGKFSRGGVNLAKKAEANVLPIAHNAATYWPMDSWLKKPGTITLHIGPVIESADKTALELNNETRDWIEQELNTIKAGETA